MHAYRRCSTRQLSRRSSRSRISELSLVGSLIPHMSRRSMFIVMKQRLASSQLYFDLSMKRYSVQRLRSVRKSTIDACRNRILPSLLTSRMGPRALISDAEVVSWICHTSHNVCRAFWPSPRSNRLYRTRY